MTAIIFSVILLISTNHFNTFINNDILDIYTLNSNYNKKYQFYSNTFQHLLGINGVFGFGIGQFGSQICLTLAKGIIYSWDISLSGYKYSIEPYEDAIQGIMTEWYVNYGIGSSSMVLGYPLVSYIALISELGLIGLFLFMKILDNKFRDSRGTFLIMFLILTNFDTYFEIPCVLVLVLVAENINNNYRRKM